MPRSSKGHGSAPRITPAIEIIINEIVSGRARDTQQLAEKSGISRRAVQKALNKDHIQAEIERRSRKQLRGFAFPRALSVMADLLNANSEYVRADVSKHIAAIHGVKPKTEGTLGASTGIAVRLIVNGQAINVAAIAGQIGAGLAQNETGEPQVIEHQRELGLENSLCEGAGEPARRIEGGRGDE